MQALLRLQAEVRQLTSAQKAALKYSWQFHGRPEQLPPPGDWQFWSYIAGRGAGKAISLDTPIPTPAGWSTMGDLAVGDMVIDEAGKACRVVAKYYPDQREQYRVTFSDGSTIDACADHLWCTWEHKDRKAYLRSVHEQDVSKFPANWTSWKPTRRDARPLSVEQQQEIISARASGLSYARVGLVAGVSTMAAWQVCQRGVAPTARTSYDDIGPNVRSTKQIAQTLRRGVRGDLNHCIPCAAPLDLPAAALLVPPYTLGAWLGDGSKNGAVITSVDTDVLTQIRLDGYILKAVNVAGDRAAMYSIRHPLQVMERNNLGQFAPRDHLLTDLKTLGVYGNKHVPSVYLRGSIEQRLALLRGLMDTDGHASGGLVEFCNTNIRLAEGVFELAASLGEKPVMATGRAKLYGKDCGPKYRVTWTPTVFNPFAMERKRSLVSMAQGAQGLRRRHRMIVSIEPINPVPMACITVDSPNSMYLAGKAMIPTHNTRSGAEFVRDCIKNGYKRGALVAPTNDDFHKVMVTGESGILACCPPWDYPEYNENKKTLTWPNGAQVFGYSAEKPNRLRGPQHDFAWCFVAGTLVATSCGEVPIETVRAGDLVWTRRGLRTVVRASVRNSAVGQIKFSDGRELTGTADHPVHLNGGWTRMDSAALGDRACVIDASSGVEIAGTCMAPAEALTMSAPTSPSSLSARFGSIGQSGNIKTGLSRSATKYTTSTTTSSTTISRIWNACQKGLIRKFTDLSIQFRRLIGNADRSSLLCALSAGMPCCAGASRKIRFANRACKSVPMQRDHWSSGSAWSAEPSSEVVPATSALSVASTWRPLGERDVYCLKVADQPEYFANGILVHNCDEIAAWHGKKNPKPGETSRRQETWDMLMYGLRLGDNPRCFISTTPLPVDVIKTLIENGLDANQEAYTITRGSTYANRSNLAERFFKSIISKYEGTRLGRQELLGELLMDVPGALWTLDMIASARITDETAEAAVDRMQRVVVAVDPSGAASMSDETADEIGIVTAGQDSAGEYAIIADDSMKGSPTQWARAAVTAYHKYKADKIVAERNFGGEMVRSVIQNVDANIPVDLVTASRGKAIRAEPIALLYERGEVHHIGIHGHLEDQLIRMTPGGYIGDGSPDRLDAAVWALTELSAGATVQHFGVA